MEKDHLPSFAGLKFLVLIFVVALAGCSRDSGLPDPDIIQSTVESGNQVYRLETTGLTEFSYTINLGTAPRDLYYVITNPGTASSGVPLPVVETVQGGVSGSVRSVNPDAAMPERTAGAEGLTGPGRALRDRVGVEEDLVLQNRGSREVFPITRELSSDEDQLNDELDFFATRWVDTNGDSIRTDNEYSNYTVPATCQSIINANGARLNIWVADNCWDDSGAEDMFLNASMIERIGPLFLNPTEPGNDIYHWVSNIFGLPWGDHDKSGLISSLERTITILLLDIDEDRESFAEGGSYVAGYYSSLNNRIATNSNERLMFYMDAPAFALKEGASWEINDIVPQDQVSTMAHEFQHLIMYYQKTVRYGQNPDTWLNELCSLAAEDLVSQRFSTLSEAPSIMGPRGIASNEATAGAANNIFGRLPSFNVANESSLTSWTSYSYPTAYAFGAFLGRNYGGAELYKNIVQSPYDGSAAVLEAVKKTNFKSVSFSQLLADWGSAVLLSDTSSDIEATQYRRYNSGTWFLDELSYRSGSINLFNYRSYYIDAATSETVTHDGPWLYSPGHIEGYTLTSNHQPTSNIYVLAASGATGIVQHNFIVGDGVKVTAVVKDASP